MSFHRTLIRLSALLAVVALAKGCGDGESPSAPPMPEPARPTTVTVSPATHELTALGATVQLTAEAFDANGHRVAGAEFSWESSDPSVATVDAAGLVTGVAEGTATITASAGDVPGTTHIAVPEHPARSPLRRPELLTYTHHTTSSALGAQKFPSAASSTISLSSVKSATARFRRPFSRSSSFRRRAWLTFIPPYSRLHR